MDDTECFKLEIDFQETLKNAKEEETVIWNSVKRVNSHSHVMLCFYNGTADTFELSTASWSLDAAPEQYVIYLWDALSFVLRAEIPTRVRGRISTPAKHSFTYKSGERSFEFSTLMRVRKKYEAFSFSTDTVAHREHVIRSIGKVPLRCFSRLTQTLANKPYHYAVAISLGGQY